MDCKSKRILKETKYLAGLIYQDISETDHEPDNRYFARLSRVTTSNRNCGLELIKLPDGTLKRGTTCMALNRMVEKSYLKSKQDEETKHAGLPRGVVIFAIPRTSQELAGHFDKKLAKRILPRLGTGTRRRAGARAWRNP